MVILTVWKCKQFRQNLNKNDNFIKIGLKKFFGSISVIVEMQILVHSFKILSMTSGINFFFLHHTSNTESLLIERKKE